MNWTYIFFLFHYLTLSFISLWLFYVIKFCRLAFFFFCALLFSFSKRHCQKVSFAFFGGQSDYENCFSLAYSYIEFGWFLFSSFFFLRFIVKMHSRNVWNDWGRNRFDGTYFFRSLLFIEGQAEFERHYQFWINAESVSWTRIYSTFFFSPTRLEWGKIHKYIIWNMHGISSTQPVSVSGR